MENILFNAQNAVNEEIKKHKDDAHGLALLSTLATDKLKEQLNITVECKTKDNMRMIADDILNNILKSIANKAYLRSCKKNDVFLESYFGYKNLENTNGFPSSPSLFLNDSSVLVDIIIYDNSTTADKSDERDMIVYQIYRKQQSNMCTLTFKTKDSNDIEKTLITLSNLGRDLENF